MNHRIIFLGSPGVGKSSMGLSYPGVEHHVFGSSEEDTALNFSERGDILKPIKLDWYEYLTDAEKAKFTDETVSEIEIGLLSQKARAKKIACYRRYLYSIKNDKASGKREELKTIFLDNGTPFSQEFEDYVKVVYGQEFLTKDGNFNSIAFYVKFQSEFSDFMRLFFSLPCNTLMSFHVSMTLDEETAARADFMKDTAKGIKHPKEWQPMVTGKSKYVLAGIPTWAFFLWVEEQAGLPNKHYAKLEADSNNVGLAKSRIQPFAKPSRIEIPKNDFYNFFKEAIDNKVKPKVDVNG